MPVKIIIRENGKQCMMQMPVKTTLRLYCDVSRLVFKCMQIHQFIATQLPCYYSFVIKMPLKNHVKYVGKQEVPLPQQRLLLCIHVRGGHQRPTQAYRPQIFYYLILSLQVNAPNISVDLSCLNTNASAHTSFDDDDGGDDDDDGDGGDDDDDDDDDD